MADTAYREAPSWLLVVTKDFQRTGLFAFWKLEADMIFTLKRGADVRTELSRQLCDPLQRVLDPRRRREADIVREQESDQPRCATVLSYLKTEALANEMMPTHSRE